jgi:hypothetical protein
MEEKPEQSKETPKYIYTVTLSSRHGELLKIFPIRLPGYLAQIPIKTYDSDTILFQSLELEKAMEFYNNYKLKTGYGWKDVCKTLRKLKLSTDLQAARFQGNLLVDEVIIEHVTKDFLLQNCTLEEYYECREELEYIERDEKMVYQFRPRTDLPSDHYFGDWDKTDI